MAASSPAASSRTPRRPPPIRWTASRSAFSTRRNAAGFFEGKIDITKRQPLRYRLSNSGGAWMVTDPYSFGPVLGPMDDYYIAEGSHLRLFDKLGAHLIDHEGAKGFNFAVWAPNAKRVSVVGEFNDWDGRRHTDAQAHRHRHLGNLHPRPRSGQGLQIRDRRLERRAGSAEGGSLCGAIGTAAGDGVGHGSAARPCLGRREAPRVLAQHEPAPRADLDLRGACRVVAEARGRLVPVVGRTRRPADPLCDRDGLHPHRVHADLGISRSTRPGATRRRACSRRPPVSASPRVSRASSMERTAPASA